MNNKRLELRKEKESHAIEILRLCEQKNLTVQETKEILSIANNKLFKVCKLKIHQEE